MKRLLLAGTNSIHTYNFIDLIKDYFDDLLLLTNKIDTSYSGRSAEIDSSLRNPLNIPSATGRIKKLAHEFRPDIVHLHQANTLSWLTLKAIKKRPYPSIVTAWGSDILLNPHRGFLYKKMIRQILENGEYFTADAIHLAEEMKYLATKPIDVRVINFGVDPICQTYEELGSILSKKENIIYSNRLHKKLYQIDKIIKAFSDLIKVDTVRNWQLVIAGSGEETTSLQRLVSDNGLNERVRFTGWLKKEENDIWYRRSKIFVTIPESDATSVSLLEAMNAGCIPVVSDLPANREWLKNDSNGIVTSDLKETDFLRAATLFETNAPHENFMIIMEKATKNIARQNFIKLYDHILTTS